MTDPVAGDLFHVYGDTARVHQVHELVLAMREDNAAPRYLVRALDGAYWVLVGDEALDDVRFRGRRIVEDR